MPPDGALSNDEIGLLRAWIDQGAEFRTEAHRQSSERLPITRKTLLLLAFSARRKWRSKLSYARHGA
jgi:hypothetical protein